MRDIYSGSKLTTQLSYISVFVGAMPLVAPIIGGYLVAYINWQSCFYLLAIGSIVLVILKVIYLPETIAERDPTAYYPSVAFKKYWRLLTSRKYMGFALIASVGFAGIFTMGSTLPFLLVNELHISPSLYGWIAGIPALGFLSGDFLSGTLSSRYSLHHLILFGAVMGILVMIIGLVINLLMPHFTVYTLIVPLIFFMFSVGFLVPTGSSGAMEPFPKLAGSASALLCASMFFAASVLTAIGSHLNIVSPAPLFILLAATSVLVFIVLFSAKKGE